MSMTIYDAFRCLSHVREAKNKDGSTANTGSRVEAIQKWGGGEKGQSWCAWALTMAIDMFWCGYLGKSENDVPIKRLGACDDILSVCMANGWMKSRPADDGVYIYFFLRNPNGGTAMEKDAHHIGLVTKAEKTQFMGASGNTSKDGKSSNGDGWYERYLPYDSRTVFARIPL